MVAPFAAAPPPEISLAPAALPNYALRTTLRMLLALGVSLVFTFTYGTLAAKSCRAEMVLVPLLDVLQSVPVLGYLSFTAVFFVSLAPNRALGAELAAIFAIFHQPGLEHGLQLLPVPALRSARSRRSEPRLSLFRLALFREHLLRFCAHNRPHLSRAARAQGAPCSENEIRGGPGGSFDLSRSGKDAAGGYRVGALRQTVSIRRREPHVFCDHEGRMSVERLSVAETSPISRAQSQRRQSQAARPPNNQISDTDVMALAGQPFARASAASPHAASLSDGSMLVSGSSGQSLAMFPEGSFCRRRGQDDGTGQSLCGCGRVVC
jgi:hypothetical protein